MGSAIKLFFPFLQALEPNSSDGSSHFFRDITSSHKRLALITLLLHPKVIWGREQTSCDSYFLTPVVKPNTTPAVI